MQFDQDFPLLLKTGLPFNNSPYCLFSQILSITF